MASKAIKVTNKPSRTQGELNTCVRFDPSSPNLTDATHASTELITSIKPGLEVTVQRELSNHPDISLRTSKKTHHNMTMKKTIILVLISVTILAVEGGKRNRRPYSDPVNPAGPPGYVSSYGCEEKCANATEGDIYYFHDCMVGLSVCLSVFVRGRNFF